MKKSILNLVGAQELTKNEQKILSGGKDRPKTCANLPLPIPGYKCCMVNNVPVTVPVSSLAC